MKNKLHRSITVFMAVLVLLSSTGFGFIEHQCMMRGKSMQFVSKKESNSCEKKVTYSCCAKRKAVQDGGGVYFKKTDCCKDSQKFEKVDVASSQSSALFKILKAASADLRWTITSFQFLRSEWVLPAYKDYNKLLSFTSLFHGRSMCVFVQSFLI